MLLGDNGGYSEKYTGGVVVVAGEFIVGQGNVGWCLSVFRQCAAAE